MKENKKRTSLIGGILLTSILLAVLVIYLGRSVASEGDILKDNNVIIESPILVLETLTKKMDLADVSQSELSMFFWFSDKCCHECVEKEIKRIQDFKIANSMELNLLVATRPLRNWETKKADLIASYSLLQNSYCM